MLIMMIKSIICIAQEGGSSKTIQNWRLLVTILVPTVTVIFLVGALLYYSRRRKLRFKGILKLHKLLTIL